MSHVERLAELRFHRPDAVAAALADAAAERGLRDLNWTDAARQTQARIGWMRKVEGEAWPMSRMPRSPPACGTGLPRICTDGHGCRNSGRWM